MSPPSRDQLLSVARDYLQALDRFDLDAVVSQFAADATFVVQTEPYTAHGLDEICAMWSSLFDVHARMRHTLRNTVVDTDERKVATEQEFVGLRKDGEEDERYSVYIFECDETGKFKRVIVWIDGDTPAKVQEPKS